MPPSGPQLIHAIKRNFGGLNEKDFDPVSIFFKNLPSSVHLPPDPSHFSPEVSV